MTKEKPAWLQEARAFCRGAGIKILAWGPDMLTVEAKSQDRATEVASQLGQLGFKTIENEDDASAGMLSLSRNPAAVQARVASFDVSRRRWDEQIEPLIWALCSLLLVARADTWRYPYWLTLPLGALSLVMFFWSGSNIWGWRLEILPEGLRVRRRFRWTTIPWGARSNWERLTMLLPAICATDYGMRSPNDANRQRSSGPIGETWRSGSASAPTSASSLSAKSNFAFVAASSPRHSSSAHRRAL